MYGRGGFFHPCGTDGHPRFIGVIWTKRDGNQGCGTDASRTRARPKMVHYDDAATALRGCYGYNLVDSRPTHCHVPTLIFNWVMIKLGKFMIYTSQNDRNEIHRIAGSRPRVEFVSKPRILLFITHVMRCSAVPNAY